MISYDKNDIFLVTGASSGIGRACVHLLNQLGASVIGVGRNQERLQETQSSASEPSRIHLEARDLAVVDDALVEWVRTLAGKYGQLRGLVHAAGRYDVLPLKVLSLDTVRQTYELNVMSAVALSKGFARRAVCTKERATITIVSSLSSMRGFAGVTAYASSKGAVNALVRSLAHELARQNIRVNAVVPGVVDTPMMQLTPPDQLAELVATHPLGIVKPESVADLIAFLSSDAARFITGQCIAVDGGASI